MIYAAKVESGIVTRVIVLPASVSPDGLVIIGPDNTVGIGWTYENGEFVAPPVEQESGSDA